MSSGRIMMSTACPGARSGGRASVPSSETMPSSVTIARRKSAAPTNSATNRVAGTVVELVGRGDLLEAARVEDPDAVGQREGLLLVVGDEDSRRARASAESCRSPRAWRRAGPRRGSRTARRAGSAPAPARGRAPARRAAAGRPTARGGSAARARPSPTSSSTSRTRRARAAAVEMGEAEGDVGLDGEVREQGVVLEDHPDAPRLRRHGAAGPGDALPADLDHARVRRLEARHEPERRRLAAARGPEERQHLAGATRSGTARPRPAARPRSNRLVTPSRRRRVMARAFRARVRAPGIDARGPQREHDGPQAGQHQRQRGHRRLRPERLGVRRQTATARVSRPNGRRRSVAGSSFMTSTKTSVSAAARPRRASGRWIAASVRARARAERAGGLVEAPGDPGEARLDRLAADRQEADEVGEQEAGHRAGDEQPGRGAGAPREPGPPASGRASARGGARRPRRPRPGSA